VSAPNAKRTRLFHLYLNAVSKATAASGIAKSPNITATVTVWETACSSEDASSGGV
jgi:hypothetical protein